MIRSVDIPILVLGAICAIGGIVIFIILFLMSVIVIVDLAQELGVMLQ